MEKRTNKKRNLKGDLEIFTFNIANLLRLYFFIRLINFHIGLAILYSVVVASALNRLSYDFNEASSFQKVMNNKTIDKNNDIQTNIRKSKAKAMSLRKEKVSETNNLELALIIISYLLTPFAFKAAINLITMF